MREKWKPVIGFETRYEVSDLGRVRSFFKQGIDTMGRQWERDSKIMKSHKSEKGHDELLLFDGVRQRRVQVRNLIAKAFNND